jgi:hypothetical protein
MRRGDPWKSGRNRLDARRWKRAALPDQIMQSRVMLQLLHISGFIQVDYRAGRYCSVVPITKKKQQKSRLLAIKLCAWYWYIIICSLLFTFTLDKTFSLCRNWVSGHKARHSSTAKAHNPKRFKSPKDIREQMQSWHLKKGGNGTF